MKAFRVVVDGKALGDLGVADFGNASVIVGIGRAGRSRPIHYDVHIGGLTLGDNSGFAQHYRWACPNIQEGSRIEIEVVESENCLPPTRLYRSDHQIQEPAFTEEEMRNMRYKSYLELKKEFEP
jgi:hypothetical protein